MSWARYLVSPTETWDGAGWATEDDSSAPTDEPAGDPCPPTMDNRGTSGRAVGVGIENEGTETVDALVEAGRNGLDAYSRVGVETIATAGDAPSPASVSSPASGWK